MIGSEPAEHLAHDTRNYIPRPTCCKVWVQKPTHKNIELQYGSLEEFFIFHDLDVICFQETKVNADDIPKRLKHVPGFESFWSVSTARKGYSGCTTYVKLEHAAQSAADDSEMPGLSQLFSSHQSASPSLDKVFLSWKALLQ